MDYSQVFGRLLASLASHSVLWSCWIWATYNARNVPYMKTNEIKSWNYLTTDLLNHISESLRVHASFAQLNTDVQRFWWQAGVQESWDVLDVRPDFSRVPNLTQIASIAVFIGWRHFLHHLEERRLWNETIERSLINLITLISAGEINLGLFCYNNKETFVNDWTQFCNRNVRWHNSRMIPGSRAIYENLTTDK